jgi:Tfp pilus assembly protein PilV
VKLSNPIRINSRRGRTAFTLLEVMIALAIFFGCVFGILALVSRSLQGARSLQAVAMDARSAIAILSLTNRLEVGPIPDEVIAAFEAENPKYDLGGEILEEATNGLFRINLMVGGVSQGDQKQAVSMNTSILLFRPQSQPSRLGPRRR